jgi:cardiolipin synthase (CMP-forming)
MRASVRGLLGLGGPPMSPAPPPPEDVAAVRRVPGSKTARTRELILPPNLLSLSRLPLAALFAVEVAASRRVVALSILVAAAGTDVADGWWARTYRQETATGRVLDPAADKLFFATAVIALAVSRRIHPFAAVLLGTREIIQIGLAVALAGKGALVRRVTTPSSVAGKMTTLLQTATVAAALVWLDATTPLALVTAACGAIAGAEYWAASR